MVDTVGSAEDIREAARQMEIKEAARQREITEAARQMEIKEMGIKEVVLQIKKVALGIKEAPRAKQNRENCQRIEDRADRVLAMLDWLEKSEPARKSVISSDLEDLHGTLSLARKLVTDCQHEKKVRWLPRFAAGDLVKQLREVNRNIRESIVRFANNVHNNNVFNTQKFQLGPIPALQEDAADENSHQSSDDIRSQVEDKETNDSPGHEAAPTRTRKEPRRLERIPLPFLRDITDNFSDERILGGDSDSTLYKGQLLDHSALTIRKFHNSAWPIQKAACDHYLRVCLVLGHHENVVRLLGLCYEVSEVLANYNGEAVIADERHDLLVEEYSPMGSLEHHIGVNQKLSWRFHVIRGIAAGVAHLHSKNVIHMNLNCSDIFLDSDMNPKLSGFGASKILDQVDTETRTDEFLGKQHYMAPEYARSGIVSVKNDVYSFGVVLLNVIAGKTEVSRDDWALGTENKDREFLLDPSRSSISDAEKIERCINIGLLCTELDPEKRPSMFRVLEMLYGDEVLPTPSHDELQDAESKPAESLSFKTFTYLELEAATNNFSKENLIAEGHIATVYKGELPGKLMVAIKRFRNSWGQQSIRKYKDIFSKTFQHKNIVKVLGYCEEVGHEMVVEDYLPTRSLSQIIDGPQPRDMDWPSRFRIILGVANALNYLHSNDIIHFDLTPANIVIFDNHMNPKICDFGLSKIRLGSEDLAKEFEVTAGSTAPEYADGVISVKNDVYSFGDLVCTLSGMSRSGPPQDLNDLAMVVRAARRMKELFDPTSCNETELKKIKECMDIGLLCTHIEPTKRPAIKIVLEKLNKTYHIDSSKKKPT